LLGNPILVIPVLGSICWAPARTSAALRQGAPRRVFIRHKGVLCHEKLDLALLSTLLPDSPTTSSSMRDFKFYVVLSHTPEGRGGHGLPSSGPLRRSHFMELEFSPGLRLTLDGDIVG